MYIFNLHELYSRIYKVREKMKEKDISALLITEPENITYLTDFFTAGYNTSFQFVILTFNYDPIIVTRHAERYWVENRTPFNKHVYYWYDGESKTEVTLRVIQSLGLKKEKIGFEGLSWRSPFSYISSLKQHLNHLVDIKNLVNEVRFIKSENEINLMRQAGVIAEEMMNEGLNSIYPNVSEREIAANIAKTEVLKGSDWSRTGPISSGEAAKHIHASYSNKKITNNDTVFLEVTPQVYNYHARFMRTIAIGEVDKNFIDFSKRLIEIQDQALDQVKSGVHCHVPDEIYRKGILDTGVVNHYHNKTFYSVGMMMMPNSFEPLEVDTKSDFIFREGMTFHSYIVVGGFSISETIAVTETGYERLTNFKRDLLNIYS